MSQALNIHANANDIMEKSNHANYYGKPVFKKALKWREKHVKSFEGAIKMYEAAMISLRDKKLEEFPEIHSIRNSNLIDKRQKKRENIMNEYEAKISRYTLKLRKMEKDGYSIPIKYLQHLERLAYLKENFTVIFDLITHMGYNKGWISNEVTSSQKRSIMNQFIMKHIKVINIEEHYIANVQHLLYAMEKDEPYC